MSKEERLLWPEKIEVDDDYYIVSRLSGCYHRPGCVWARKIKRVNKAPYSPGKGVNRRPCQYCRPE